ncbi:hypothetical protein [Crocosphaera chwakensis]|uniref:Uncharacterized protein n=1 Tax=Crocosphaera chwakensis CCY0110 TaxID=391612 RepID=A3IRM5_9CHRO|nr:hypothetical protein [Crocosphaera chwakensis]EAZ90874.1 hypothetical protein CY0110_25626 [Crocosphaera chwakensis CCY0110]
MIGNIQERLLEYVSNGQELKYIADFLNLSKLSLKKEIENLEERGYLQVANHIDGSIYSCWLTDEGWLYLDELF